MLDNLIIWGVAMLYMAFVVAFAIACVVFFAKLDGWFQDWINR